MAKSLVIVESPAKARTINRYLGKDFIVKSSVGHIRDLPTSSSGNRGDAKTRAKAAAETRKLDPERRAKKTRQQLIARMGIDPEQGWKANYQVLPGKEKVVGELRKLARSSAAVYLATDLDREGEAIAWHLQETIGGDGSRFKRVIFNEITRKAIELAFAAPGQIDMKHVQAQQARRFLDRVVGYMVSPLLWAKIARGLSAGRVQSVAVRLAVEREREIRSFVPEEYWELHAELLGDYEGALRFMVNKHRGKNFSPKTEAEVQTAMAALQPAAYQVSKREDKPTLSRPRPPLITSTLQQAASVRLGFRVRKTMTLAQRLYENGLITYMRTDSTYIGNDAIAACRGYIKAQFGADYLPPSPNYYRSRQGAQEAHEAIRPTDVKTAPNSPRMADLERDAARLYNLIWQHFVACQMTPARYTSSAITVQAGEYELGVKGRIMEFDGHTRVLPATRGRGGSGDGDLALPDLKVNDPLRLQELKPSQHFTKPAPRYTEASLVKELEKRNIGRPSTYASIISTIQERGYVKLENGRFYAQKMGDIVTDRLVENFSDLMNYDFTAQMEDTLDEIASGKKQWLEVLDEFYEKFTRQLEKAQLEDKGMRRNSPTETDIKCPGCQRNMQIRTGATGVFLGCSGYGLPEKERCKATLNLLPGGAAVSVEADDEAESRLLLNKRRCPRCNAAMDSYLIDAKRKLHVCGNNPGCPGFAVERGEFKLKGYEGPTLECDKCGAEMQLKSGRFGKYFGCTSAECGNTRKLLRSGQPAPPKAAPVPMPELACDKVDDHYVLRDGAAGLFLAASNFPQNRETRAPLVEELLPHKDEIDPKYAYLLEAPAADPGGSKAVIRFNRKSGEHYVRGEKDGKPTGWKATCRAGRWDWKKGKG